jgi:NAD(P)-dependent dehydrogenase (short-subunit alcohol dehydrogenase family)
MTDINHDNKICLVTGASSGIGAATARALVQRGATVVGVARGAVAIDGVESLTADLAVLDDVRELADKLRGRYGRIDVLINNAGVAKFRRELTPDGFERTFATNHLGPFLLTNLLKESLADGRVITVSSSGHRQVKSLDWDTLPTGGAFGSLATYNVTKLLNVLFTAELARRGATANCADPGFVRTNLGREATGGFALFLKASAVFQARPDKGGAHLGPPRLRGRSAHRPVLRQRQDQIAESAGPGHCGRATALGPERRADRNCRCRVVGQQA